MRNLLSRPFFAVFQNEVRLNSKRAAPYVLMLLFIVNAVMWSVRGAAAMRGWATNSDFNIARNFLAFSWVLGLPIFNAVIMGDPVLRDFRLGVDSLIFSKPISRASYLIGKFLGSRTEDRAGFMVHSDSEQCLAALKVLRNDFVGAFLGAR